MNVQPKHTQRQRLFAQSDVEVARSANGVAPSRRAKLVGGT